MCVQQLVVLGPNYALVRPLVARTTPGGGGFCRSHVASGPGKGARSVLSVTPSGAFKLPNARLGLLDSEYAHRTTVDWKEWGRGPCRDGKAVTSPTVVLSLGHGKYGVRCCVPLPPPPLGRVLPAGAGKIHPNGFPPQLRTALLDYKCRVPNHTCCWGGSKAVNGARSWWYAKPCHSPTPRVAGSYTDSDGKTCPWCDGPYTLHEIARSEQRW